MSYALDLADLFKARTGCYIRLDPHHRGKFRPEGLIFRLIRG